MSKYSNIVSEGHPQIIGILYLCTQTKFPKGLTEEQDIHACTVHNENDQENLHGYRLKRTPKAGKRRPQCIDL